MTTATDNDALRVSVLLHLATPARWPALLQGIRRIENPVTLMVNVVREMDGGAGGNALADMVAADWPDAEIMISDNRGMDIGGMLRLFLSVRRKPCDAILYAHGKSDLRWFGDMLTPLVAARRKIIPLLVGQAEGDAQPVGMVGAWAYPYDYFNPDACLSLAERMGIRIETGWERYYQRFPALRDLPLAQRIAHARDHHAAALRPEMDLDYLRDVAGEWQPEQQPMRREWISRFAADGVLGALPYFPGNFFWVRPAVVRRLASCMDLEAEIHRLPATVNSDLERQSLAHAWERMLPVFAMKQGFRLVDLSRSGNTGQQVVAPFFQGLENP